MDSKLGHGTKNHRVVDDAPGSHCGHGQTSDSSASGIVVEQSSGVRNTHFCRFALLRDSKQFREPFAVQFGVTNRGRDRPVPQVPLDDPDVGSFVDQSVTATVPQHVRVNLKMLEISLSCNLPNQEPHRTTRQRLAPLADKERVAIGLRGVPHRVAQ